MELRIRAIVEKAREGNAEAFGILYQMYYPKMKGICIKMLKEDGDVVDDLVQDAFVLALLSVKDLKKSQSFSQWLTSITTNLVLKYQENRQKVRLVSLSTIEGVADEKIGGGPLSVGLSSYDELMAAIEKLPEGYRKVFKMSELDGLSHQEISQLLHIAPHSSSSQLARAKSMLKKMLNTKTFVFFALALIGVAVYRYFMTKEPSFKEKEGVVAGKEKSHHALRLRSQTKHPGEDSSLHAILSKRHVQDDVNYSAVTVDEDTLRNLLLSMADTVGNKNSIVVEDRKVAGLNREKIPISDSILLPYREWNLSVAEVRHNEKKRNGKWKILAVGSLGTALVQNVYKTMMGQDHSTGGGQTELASFSTWEDYARYLHRLAETTDTIVDAGLLEIADHNQGKIIEYEHHDRPVMFGLSINKNLKKGWSLETGLQYSYLKSTFCLGVNDYRLEKIQKLHYVGIPFRVACLLAKYKNFSAYGSAGVGLQIPVYGKTTVKYVTDVVSEDTASYKVTPPLQWMVNTSVGVQYQFAPKLNLFIEPTLNWYIPAGGSTKNAWTERSFTFAIPFGIRYTW